MNNPRCGACGAAMKRNGKTSAGAQRRRCGSCGASATHRINSTAKELASFLRRLFPNRRQGDFGRSSRTFRRKAPRFWKMRPLPSYAGEVRDAVLLDGIRVSGLVVLIACTKENVLAWHLATSERSGAWCSKWESFLREFTIKDGRRRYVHRELRRARRALNGLVRSGTLFTFVEMAEERGGEWDSTSNMIEGGVNARLREMARNHRGLSRMRRVKAIFRWCCMRTESPLPAAEMIEAMPTDDEVEGLFAMASKSRKREDGAPDEHGSEVVWGEFHAAVEYRQ